MSAVFEVIALGIARRAGQQAAGSTRQERHREIRARKRQRGDTERPVDCDLASEEETKGSEVDSEEMDFDSDCMAAFIERSYCLPGGSGQALPKLRYRNLNSSAH